MAVRAQFQFEPEVFENFFKLLPHTHKEAANIGSATSWLNGRTWLEIEEDRPLRHAVEVRHKSFACEEYVELLRKYELALVVADTPVWPRLFDITADFMYCRLHGSEKLYSSGYTPEAIEVWAGRVLAWSRGEEVSDGTKASPHDGKKLLPATCSFTSTTTRKFARPTTPRACRKESTHSADSPTCGNAEGRERRTKACDGEP